MSFTKIKNLCLGCGRPLTYVRKYEGLPCNNYCCSTCCPNKNDEGGCPKEKKFGSWLDALKGDN